MVLIINVICCFIDRINITIDFIYWKLIQQVVPLHQKTNR